MGRKGVSKRKPKKNRPVSKVDNSGSSNTRQGESPSMQSVVKDKGAPLYGGHPNPSSGSNKKHKKGN